MEISAAEARAVYDCLKPEMTSGYVKAGLSNVRGYLGWTNAATAPYLGATHGNRYVNNWVNGTGRAAYLKYEDVGRVPVGTVVAKDSFVVHPNGRTGAGPLFVMEKMGRGFNAKTDDWRYTMVMPDGAVFGTTNGTNSAGVTFCAECHAAVAEDQDSLMFLPAEFRMQ